MLHIDRKIHIPIIMMIAISIGVMATDIFLPSFPKLEKIFAVTSDDIQLYLSVFMFTSLLASFFSGSLSDYYGRRPMIIAGLLIFSISSALCSVATSHEQVLFFRALQGIGSGVISILGDAAISDIYGLRDGAKIRSYMGIAISISPIAGVLLGGYIEEYLNWRFGFYFLSISSAALVIYAFYYFFETLKFCSLGDVHAGGGRLRSSIASYAKIIINHQFVLYAITPGVFFVGYMAMLSVAPFYYQNVMGISPSDFSILMSLATLGFIFGNFTVSQLITRNFDMDHILFLGIFCSIVSLVLHIIVAVVKPVSPYLVTFLVGLYFYGFSFSFSPSMSKALNMVSSNERGSASSIAATLRAIFGLLGTLLGYYSPDNNFFVIAVVSLFILALLFALIVINYRRSGLQKKEGN